MVSDIVERLKWRGSATDMPNAPTPTLCREAAAEIERLRAALRPFASYYDPYVLRPDTPDSGIPANTPHTVGEYRRARAALAREKKDGS